MKKILIILFVLIIIFGIVAIIYNQNSKIKKGDIFSNISIKNDIPKINSKSEATIGIFDSENNIRYTIIYNGNLLSKPYIAITVSEEGKSEESYRYSWENIERDLDNKTVSLPKGWSIHKTSNGYDNKFIQIQELPIQSISGTVDYTEGNTSLIKKILIGL